jgi:hypothetical protein
MKKITLLLIAIVTLCFSFSAKAQCDYTLEMNDSWGDGWNGNTMDVLVNGVEVLDDVTFTELEGIPAGEQLILPFTVNDGDLITTLWNGGGGFGGETSYRIISVNDVVVGSGSQTSITTDIAASCALCTAPVATLVGADTSDCVAGTFSFILNVSDLGGAASIEITNTAGVASTTVMAVGDVTLTGFPTDTVFDVTLADDEDSSCDVVLAGLSFACPPVNDNFVDAIAITAGASVIGTTVAATIDEAGAPEGTNADLDTPNVWYSYTGTGVAEDVTLSTCGVVITNFDTEALIFTGTSGNLTFVAEGYDECGGGAEGFHFETTFASDGTSTYWISMSGYNGAEGNFEIVVSAATLSTETFENENAFTYFPNPVKNELTLNSQKDIQNVSVYNMLGQEVVRTAPNSVNSTIDMNGLSQGAYFVKVTIGNVTETIRVIKQ